MAERATEHPKIRVFWDTKPEKINPDAEGKVQSISITNLKTGKNDTIECKGVFIAIVTLLIQNVSMAYYLSMKTDTLYRKR